MHVDECMKNTIKFDAEEKKKQRSIYAENF